MSQLMTCQCGHQFEPPNPKLGLDFHCPICGHEFTASKPPTIDDWPAPSKLSGNAIASLLLGIVFILAFLTGIPAILLGRKALKAIDQSQGRLRGRGLARAGIFFGIIGCLFTFIIILMPATRSASEAARRSQCRNNLKQIGLALNNYHQVHGCLPPRAIKAKDGRSLLSWRVAILPYIDEKTLYAKFHLDEPWDSLNNLPLFDEMPAMFVCPSDPNSKRGTTGYVTIIGPDMGLSLDAKPLKFDDFTDGTSNTLIVSESRTTVPWSKPDDHPFDPALPMGGLGSHHGYHVTGVNGLFANGRCRWLKKSIELGIFRTLLTRNTGEVLPKDEF